MFCCFPGTGIVQLRVGVEHCALSGVHLLYRRWPAELPIVGGEECAESRNGETENRGLRSNKTNKQIEDCGRGSPRLRRVRRVVVLRGRVEAAIDTNKVCGCKQFTCGYKQHELYMPYVAARGVTDSLRLCVCRGARCACSVRYPSGASNGRCSNTRAATDRRRRMYTSACAPLRQTHARLAFKGIQTLEL